MAFLEDKKIELQAKTRGSVWFIKIEVKLTGMEKAPTYTKVRREQMNH